MTQTRLVTKQQQVIYDMITENTGRALCDSGDYYGRHYETNGKFSIEDFIAREPATIKFEGPYRDGDYWPNVTLELFHFIDNTLYFEEEADEFFHNVFIPDVDDEGGNRSWYEMVNEFADWMKDLTGDEWILESGDNSYNYDNCLSQDIQWHTVINNNTGETYLLLQTHNGCDARGGYSKPRVFSPVDDYSWCFYNDYTLCTDEYDPTPANQLVIDESIRPLTRYWVWDFHGGYPDTYEDNVPQWEDMNVVEMPEDGNPEWNNDTIFVDKDGNGFIYGMIVQAYPSGY